MKHIAPSVPDSLAPAVTTPPFIANKRGWLVKTLAFTLVISLAWSGWISYQLHLLRTINPEQSAFMQRYSERNPDKPIKHHWVRYSHISPHLKRAVIAAEDTMFIEHGGFDWQGIRLALEKNLKRGTITAGGSTISQQLVKNLFLSPQRSFLRKAEEMVITIIMEKILTKKRIFELYLNYAEWGKGIYGAEAAAHRHFGVSAARLSSWQAARLAAILPNPRYYDGRRTEWMYEKTDTIIKRMPQVHIPR